FKKLLVKNNSQISLPNLDFVRYLIKKRKENNSGFNLSIKINSSQIYTASRAITYVIMLLLTFPSIFKYVARARRKSLAFGDNACSFTVILLEIARLSHMPTCMPNVFDGRLRSWLNIDMIRLDNIGAGTSEIFKSGGGCRVGRSDCSCME